MIHWTFEKNHDIVRIESWTAVALQAFVSKHLKLLYLRNKVQEHYKRLSLYCVLKRNFFLTRIKLSKLTTETLGSKHQ